MKEPEPTLALALAQARQALAHVAGEDAGHEARLLIEHVAGRTRAQLAAHPETPLTPAQAAELDALVRRRAGGEPLPYLLGRWEFYGLAFEVTPVVLIPRPETELLVEQALAWLAAHPGRRAAADIGAGSGCIAVALAHHAPGLRVFAVDRSMDALRVAARNVQAHGLAQQVHLAAGDLLRPLAGPLDLIAANLPYIPRDALRGLPVYGREPALALDGGADGLDCIRRLLAQAPTRLAPGGLLLLEIEAGQGPAALALARQAFPQAGVRCLPDLAGRDRLISVAL